MAKVGGKQQDPDREAIRQKAGAVKIGLRDKKGSGFWKAAETVAVLRDFNDEKISEEQAMRQLGIGQDFVALRYYAKRLKKAGSSARFPRAEFVRTITGVGGSIGITLPAKVADAYGFRLGAIVELEPMEEGLLVRPVRMVSALEPEGRQRVREIIEQYRPALEAMARDDKATKIR